MSRVLRSLINIRNENKPEWKNYLIVLMVAVLFLIFPGHTNAQVGSYTFTASGTGSFLADRNNNVINLTSGTTVILNPSLDDAISPIQSIGFSFPFAGISYTQFSVSSNGLVKLGAVQPTTTQYSFGQTNQKLLSAMAGDLEISSSGLIQSKLVGTAPSRCLVIEFKNMGIDYTGFFNFPDGTWQVRLYESGEIEYVYGDMYRNDSPTNQPLRIGFSTGSGTGNILSVNSAAESFVTNGTFVNNNYPLDAFISSLNAPVEGSRKLYTFLESSAPVINYPALSSTLSVANRVLPAFADVSDPDGVNTAIGTRPRLYYKRATDANTYIDNTPLTAGWKFAEAENATSPFDFTINYLLLQGGTGVLPGQTIQYFVVAQDLAAIPNVGINAGNFAAAPVSVALTAAAFPVTGAVRSYAISQPFSGTINVGASQTYPNLTGFNGLFKAINENVVSGNITVNITSDLTENGQFPLNQVNETGPGNYAIRIQSSGSPRLITQDPSITATHMIGINGADRVSFDGGTDTLLKFRNNSQTSPGVVFQFNNASVQDTVKNCLIESNTAFPEIGAITIYGVGRSKINILNNYIRPPFGNAELLATGIYSQSDSNVIVVKNNHIYNWDEYGVNIPYSGDSCIISNNSFYNNQPTPSVMAQSSIHISGGYGHLVAGNYIGGSAPLAGGNPWLNEGDGTFYGITLINDGAGAPVSIQGNTVSNISQASTVIGNFYGIDIPDGNANIGTDSGNVIGSRVAPNSIHIGGSGTFYGIYSFQANSVIENNVIANAVDTTQYPSTFYGIYIGGANTITVNKNQVYDIGPTNPISVDAVNVNGIYMFGGNANPLPCTISNNMVSLGNGFTTEHIYFGIVDDGFLNNNIYVYNNTVRIGGTAIGPMKTFAYSNNVNSNEYHKNNIYINMRTGGTGKHFAFSSIGTSGILASDYNVLYALDSLNVCEKGVGNGMSFIQWKATTGGDINSMSDTVKFISHSNLHIDTSHQSSWTINGRGLAIGSVPTDIDGDIRPIVTGVPTDIGADEFTPVVLPPLAARSGVPAPGTTTSYSSAERKIVDIIWANTGAVPPVQNVRYFSGTKPPNYNSFASINSYYDIDAPGGSGYNYTIKYYYTDAEKNNIPDANLKIIKQDGSNPWVNIGGTPGMDANGKFITVAGLTGFSKFSLINAAAPLPVTMGELIAVKKDGNNLLQWNTFSESNNSGFEIQRSEDGISFRSISFVGSAAAGGNSNSGIAYSFTDRNFIGDRQFYRLRQVDTDGRFSFSNIAIIKSKEDLSLQLISVYPNPVDAFLNLEIQSALNETAEIRVTDITGKVIRYSTKQLSKGRNTLTLPMSTLLPGNYMILITTPAQRITVRFVKR
ncbi:MAG: T9SS type A sorting domain-containing protein [Ferruginibacter sp.]